MTVEEALTVLRNAVLADPEVMFLGREGKNMRNKAYRTEMKT